MRVLVVNAGSSSLKVAVVAGGDLDRPGVAERELTVARWDGHDASQAVESVLAGGPSVDAVGHRVVHGGRHLVAPAVVDDDLEARIAGLVPLAPLHQPRALAALRSARACVPGVPHVACFDTAFHATMPSAARTYALPEPWRAAWGLDRLGFHGLSHAWAARRAAELVDDHRARRIVTCHLGAGASLCAVLDGDSVDTTMGFTPLDGLVMATRSGAVDPGIVLWLLTHGGLDARAVQDGLEHHGGLAGLSGTSGDMRDVLAARAAGGERAALAFDVFVHRLRREIASMAAAMDGLDTLVFTGGIGEHAPEVRAEAAAGLGFLGVAVDPGANEAATGDTDVSTAGAPVRTLVVESREDLEVAAQVRQVLGGPAPAVPAVGSAAPGGTALGGTRW